MLPEFIEEFVTWKEMNPACGWKSELFRCSRNLLFKYLRYAIMDHKLLRDLVLLSLLTSLYMLFGAVVFQTLENRLGEDLTTKNLTESLEKDLLQKFNATRQELVMILARVREIVGKESNAQKTEWTLYSSLYFVGSVITTIGKLKRNLVQ